MIDVFRISKFLRSHEPLEVLNIDALDSIGIKAINKQMDNLQSNGLIKVVPGGWK